MGAIIGFFIGLFVGAMIGVFSIALMVAARDGDKASEAHQTVPYPEHVNCRCWVAPSDDRVRDISEYKNKETTGESNDQSPAK